MKLNKYILAAIWLGMFILCAVLGYLPAQEGGNKWLLVIFALLFFLPPVLLLYLCWEKRDLKLAKLLRLISLIVVISTVVLLVINLLSITLLLAMPQQTALALGDILYDILLFVSTPMSCGQFWGIGLIGWIVLLWSSIFMVKSLQKTV